MNERWRARWRAFWDGPAWPLPAYLLLALALRLPTVLLADGYEFVDQQYQYVDPAWHLASGAAWHRTWEWIDGIRSLVYPGMLAGVLDGAAAAGCDGPMAAMTFARAVHALLSLLPLWAFWLLVVRWRPLAAPRLPLALLAGSGLLLTSVQPSGPALATTLVLTAGVALAGPTRFVVLGGLCLGLAFCCRFQDALFGPAFVAVLLAQRRWRDAAAFALACCPGIALQGAVDVATGSVFLGTPWRYVASNIGLGSASKWQAQPLPFYLYAGVVPLLCFVPPWLRVALARLRAGAQLLPAALAGAVLHLAVHSCIARKALRFEYSALALLLAVLAVGVSARRSRGHTTALVAVHAALWLWASLWAGNAGAVATANWLRDQPEFATTGEVVVVGGDATALGGFFYARPPCDRVVAVERDRVAERLRDPTLDRARWLVAVREPLPGDVAAAAALELTAVFRGRFDLRRGERRFVYRRRA